ncbi:glycosyl hydrolase family 28-related protein [Roseomonas sp. 18066]|uniref:glycosyl hydrolase family 28-related protein n=1 Tax=Roseomonas sp. 18066 TaxID=2681412 RepID=UPI00190F4E57|nr:glycosyl hydrolase family 28-related protein [Roseomonas sp. 18066]
MPDKKITELPVVSAVSDQDIAPVVQGGLISGETRRTTVAQLRAGILAERPLHVREFGAVGDGTTDDTAAINAAISAAFALGGGTVMLGPRRYLVNSAELLVRENVILMGQPHQGGFRMNSDYATLRYALLLNPSYTIRVQRNGGIHGVAILRAGMTRATTLRQGLDEAAAFAGTAITVGNGAAGGSAGNGADSSLTRLLILGFNWGIYSDGNARVRVNDILGDCTNGLYLGRSFDVSRISEVNWHPLLTTARSWSNTRLPIAAVENNGAGLFRLTTASAHGLSTGDMVNIAEVRTSGAPACYGRWIVTVVDSTRLDLQGSAFAGSWGSGGAVYINPNRRLGIAFVVNDSDMASFENCFEYGHEIGFDIRNAVHAGHFNNIGTDGWNDMADPTTIGIRIAGTSLRNKVVGGFISSKGCSVQVSTTGTEQHEIIGVDVTGGARRIAEVLSGQLSFLGCDFTGAPGTSNVAVSTIHLGASAGSVIVNGCDTSAVTFTADTAAAMQRLQLLGNRQAPGTATTQRIAAGRVELASVSASAAIETRLSADTDGAVNIHRRSASDGAQITLANSANAAIAQLTVAGNDLVLETRSGSTPTERLRLASNGTLTVATGPLVLAADPTAALHAATRQYVDAQFTDRRMTTVLLSGATALAQASHNARMLIANPGTTLSINWASTGDGFSCSVVNRTGADLAFTLSGFTGSTPSNSDGFTKIRSGGVATLLVYSPDGGTTRICHLTGAGAP